MLAHNCSRTVARAQLLAGQLLAWTVARSAIARMDSYSHYNCSRRQLLALQLLAKLDCLVWSSNKNKIIVNAFRTHLPQRPIKLELQLVQSEISYFVSKEYDNILIVSCFFIDLVN